jgi:hypothetical protein
LVIKIFNILYATQRFQLIALTNFGLIKFPYRPKLFRCYTKAKKERRVVLL